MWGLRPKDFWRLHPIEFWWLFDIRKPVKTYIGGMTEEQVAEIYNEAYGGDDD